jgi:hypothetical protein
MYDLKEKKMRISDVQISSRHLFIRTVMLAQGYWQVMFLMLFRNIPGSIIRAKRI